MSEHKPNSLPVYNRSRFAVIICGWGFSVWSKPFSLVAYYRWNKNVWTAKAVLGYLPDDEAAWDCVVRQP